MLDGGKPMHRFWIIGTILFCIVLLSPEFSRAASPAAEVRLADIVKKARDEKDIIFQIGEPHGKYSTAQTERQMVELVKKNSALIWESNSASLRAIPRRPRER